MRRVLLAVALIAACGNGPEPAPTSLTSTLSRVDRLVAAHDYAAARLALEDLVRRTAVARQGGDIDATRADRITAAAARLAAALPRPVVTPSPTPSPQPRDSGGGGSGKKKKGHDKGEGD
jgi:hypothetical protein